MKINGSSPSAQSEAHLSEQAEDLSLWTRLRILTKDNFQQRPFVAWLIIFAVALVLYLRVVDPLIEWAADTRQEAVTLARSLAGLEALAQREKTRLKKLELDYSRLQQLAATLPAVKPAQAQNELAKRARKLAESQGLKVVNSLILAPKSIGNLQRVALRLTADGSYEHMRKFLAAFPNSPSFMAPASFTIGPSPVAQGQLRLECEVVTLLRRQP
jgi:hypothetical protein